MTAEESPRAELEPAVPGGGLRAALYTAGRGAPSSAAEVELLAQLLWERATPHFVRWPDDLAVILEQLLAISSRMLSLRARKDVVPVLLAHLEPLLADPPNALVEVLLTALKVLALHPTKEGVSSIVYAARIPLAPHAFQWRLILGLFRGKHPYRHALVDGLREPLPEGQIARGLLELANHLSQAFDLEPHPFDQPAGWALLESWLLDPEPSRYRDALTATSTLPFLGSGPREPLLAKAMLHPNPIVQMEAAWCGGRLGLESGIEQLARFCLEPSSSPRAMQYLAELNREDAVPRRAREPAFLAMAELCQHLSHPLERGKAPARITLLDSRELYWPPTGDRRQLWLFRFEDEDGEGRGEGLVGSVTASLTADMPRELSVDELYALHCAWELGLWEGGLAPLEGAVATGRALLAAQTDSLPR